MALILTLFGVGVAPAWAVLPDDVLPAHVDFFIDPSDAESYKIDPAVKAAQEARDRCQAQACDVEKGLAAREEKGYGGICNNRNDKALLEYASCSNGDIGHPNPFKIARLFRADYAGKKTDRVVAKSTPACRYYLLKVAEQQSKVIIEELDLELKTLEAKANDGDETAGARMADLIAKRDTLALGADLQVAHEIDGSCKLANETFSQDTLVNVGSIINAEAVKDPKIDDDYCSAIGDKCSVAGGKRIEVSVYAEVKEGDVTKQKVTGRRVACVSNGVVLDESCLKQDKKKLEKLKYALAGVKGESENGGVGCLKGIAARVPEGGYQEGTSKAAELLKENFSKVKTQICCGKSCTSSVFPGGAGGRIEGAQADSSGSPPNEHGTIRLYGGKTGALHSKLDNLKSTLFHEYLHRIGACTSANHTNYASITKENWVVPAKADGSCPAKGPTDSTSYAEGFVTGCYIETSLAIYGGWGMKMCRLGEPIYKRSSAGDANPMCTETCYCIKDEGCSPMNDIKFKRYDGKDISTLKQVDDVLSAEGYKGAVANPVQGAKYCTVTVNTCGETGHYSPGFFNPAEQDPIYGCEKACFPSSHGLHGKASDYFNGSRKSPDYVKSFNACAGGFRTSKNNKFNGSSQCSWD